MNTNQTTRMITLAQGIDDYVSGMRGDPVRASRGVCFRILTGFAQAYPGASLVIIGPKPPARPRNCLDLHEARTALACFASSRSVPAACGAALALFAGARSSEITNFNGDQLSKAGIILFSDGTGRSRRIPWNRANRAWLEPLLGFKGPLFGQYDVKALRRALRVFHLSSLRATFIWNLVAKLGTPDAAAIADIPHETSHLFVPKRSAPEFYDLTPRACGVPDWEARVGEFIQNHRGKLRA